MKEFLDLPKTGNVYCGKYKRIRNRGIICDKCGVEVTLSRVRRERMGHIALAAPVSHVWFFKGSSSPLSLILDMSQKNLESVIYYASYLVTELDEEKKKQGLLDLEKTIEQRKQAQKKEIELDAKTIAKEMEEKLKGASKTKVKGEQKELMNQEFDLQKRQRMARLEEREAAENKKLDEIQDAAFLNSPKSLKVGSVLSKMNTLSFWNMIFRFSFTIKTGAEGLSELIEKIDVAGLIVWFKRRNSQS